MINVPVTKGSNVCSLESMYMYIGSEEDIIVKTMMYSCSIYYLYMHVDYKLPIIDQSSKRIR